MLLLRLLNLLTLHKALWFTGIGWVSVAYSSNFTVKGGGKIRVTKITQTYSENVWHTQLSVRTHMHTHTDCRMIDDGCQYTAFVTHGYYYVFQLHYVRTHIGFTVTHRHTHRHGSALTELLMVWVKRSSCNLCLCEFIKQRYVEIP